MNQKVSQLVGMIAAPSLGLPIVTAASPPQFIYGQAATYQFAATSDLTVTWSVVSGTLPTGVTLSSSGLLSVSATAAALDYPLIVGAANTRGTQTAPLTVGIVYQASLEAFAITGKPVAVILPVADTVASVQYASNTGSGPVPISGATSTAWTPTASDVSSLLSATGRTTAGARFFTPTYTAAKQIISTTGTISWPTVAISSISWAAGVVTVVTATPHGIPQGDINTSTMLGQVPSALAGSFAIGYVNPTTFSYPLASDPGPATTLGTFQRYGPSYGGINHGAGVTSLTLLYPTAVRSIGSNGYYVDQILAPGSYTANDPILVAGLTGAPSNTLLANIVINLRAIATPPPVVQSHPDTAPATSTRPTGNTGTGFFVNNGAVYDPNGNKFRIRGINQCHFDSGSLQAGLPVAKPNTVRMATYLSVGWTSDTKYPGFPNKTLVDNNTAKKIVTMPAPQGVPSLFNATISGNILTVTSVAYGLLTPQALPWTGALTTYGVTGTGFTSFYIMPYGTGGTTGTGKTGTYQISVSQTLATSTLMAQSGLVGTGPGSTDGALLDNAGQVWADQSAAWTTYNDRLIINIINEWGPDATTFTGTISGTTLTVATAANGVFTLRVGMSFDIPGNGTARVTALGTGIGGAGTYTIDTSLTVSTAVTMRDSTWREAYIRNIAKMRAAGYTCLLCVDAPGNGQSPACLSNGDALAILNADPQHNVLFSLHQYGGSGQSSGGTFGGPSGPLAAMYAAQQASLGSSVGLSFIVGEYGCGQGVGPSPTTIDPLEIIAACEAFNFGHMPWAWDDPGSVLGPLAYDLGFALCQWAGSSNPGGGGYKTGNSAELSDFGRKAVEHPILGIKTLAVPATIY